MKKLIADECVKVAEKDGIRLNFDFVEATNKEFKGSRNVSSMQQDLLKRKNTEIGYLNGAVAKLGKKYGIQCPANEAIAEIIKSIENFKTDKPF